MRSKVIENKSGTKRKFEEMDRLSIFQNDDESDTAIIRAAKNNHTEMVKLLLEAGANPNDHLNEDSALHDCLHYAVRNNNLEMVKLVFEYGYDLSNASDWKYIINWSEGKTKEEAYNPLYFAIKKGYQEIAIALLNNGYPCTYQNGIVKRNAFKMAASQGNIELVKLMLRNSKEEQKKTNQSSTETYKQKEVANVNESGAQDEQQTSNTKGTFDQNNKEAESKENETYKPEKKKIKLATQEKSITWTFDLNQTSDDSTNINSTKIDDEQEVITLGNNTIIILAD